MLKSLTNPGHIYIAEIKEIEVIGGDEQKKDLTNPPDISMQKKKTRRWNSGLFCRFQPTDTSDVALLFLLKFFDMKGAKKRGNCRCACTLYSS